VLGPEDGDHVDPSGGDHRVDDVGEVLQDAGRVGDDPHALPAQRGPPAAREPVGAGGDGAGRAAAVVGRVVGSVAGAGTGRASPEGQCREAETGRAEDLSPVDRVHRWLPGCEGARVTR
jgi:hypothetical protein